MADTRTVRIEILGSGTGTSSGKNGKDGDKDKNPYGEFKKDLSKMLHPIKTAEAEIIGENVIIEQAVQLAKQGIKQTVDYGLGRYFTLTEDYLGENTYNRVKTKLNKVGGAFTSIASGAIIGAKLGPVGAVAGASIAALGYGVSLIFEYQNRMSGYYQQLNATNYQTEFSSQRASLYNGTQNTLG